MIEYPRLGEKLLSDRVKNVLFRMIKDGEFDATGHLPPEADLAAKLHVSRTVVRDVYRLLETEGYIIRRRGIGTLINYNVLRVKVRLDVDHENEFYDLVREMGYSPATEFITYTEVPASKELMQRFGLQRSEPVSLIERLITADSVPVIYCRNYFPVSFLCKKVKSEEDINRPIFEFLDHYCDITVHHEIANVKPILFSSELMEMFRLERTEPGLHLMEVAYDIDQQPVLYSEEFHRSGILNHTLLRKKI